MKKLLILISCVFMLSGYTAVHAEVEPLELSDDGSLDNGGYWEDWGDDYYYYGDDYGAYYEDDNGYFSYDDLTGEWDAGSWESDGYAWWNESTWDTGGDSYMAYDQVAPEVDTYGWDDSDLLLQDDDYWDGEGIIGGANEPEPFYFPIQPFTDEEIDLARKNDVEKYGSEVGNRITDDAVFANTLTGPQFDSVMMMEGGLEWAGIADFVEQGVKDGTVDIHKKTWDEELARVGPEGKADYELAVARESYGIVKPYISGQIGFDDDREVNVIFSNSHREWPVSSRAFLNEQLNTILIDTRKTALKADDDRRSVALLDEAVKKGGWPTNSLGTAGLSDNELFWGDVSNNLRHEGEHWVIGEKVKNMVDKGIPDHIKKYYPQLPPEELLDRSIGELAALTKEIGEGSFPNLNLYHFDTGTMKAIEGKIVLDPVQVPHFYAKLGIVPRVLNAVDYPNFMAGDYADKSMPHLNFRGAMEERRIRESIREAAKNDYAPDGLGSRIIFLEQVDPKKLNQAGIIHHDYLFGETPSIKPESLEQFKDEVIEEYEFNKSYRY